MANNEEEILFSLNAQADIAPIEEMLQVFEALDEAEQNVSDNSALVAEMLDKISAACAGALAGNEELAAILADVRAEFEELGQIGASDAEVLQFVKDNAEAVAEVLVNLAQAQQAAAAASAAATDANKAQADSAQAAADALASDDEALNAFGMTSSDTEKAINSLAKQLGPQYGQESIRFNANVADNIQSLLDMAQANFDSMEAIKENALAFGISADELGNLTAKMNDTASVIELLQNQMQVLDETLGTANETIQAQATKIAELTDDIDQADSSYLAAAIISRDMTQALLDQAVQIGATSDIITTLREGLDQFVIAVGALNGAVSTSDSAMVLWSDGISYLSDNLLKLNPNLQDTITKQGALVRSSLSAAESLLTAAQAGGASETSIKQLQDVVVNLTGQLNTLIDAERMLDTTFGDSDAAIQTATSSLSAYDQAVIALAQAMGNLNMTSASAAQKELDQATAAAQAAQALYDQASAAGASDDALAQINGVIAGLNDKVAMLRQQIVLLNETQIAPKETPPTEESPNTPGGAQASGFMMLMVAQRVMQLGQAFVQMGVSADTAFTTIAAETNISGTALDGMKGQLEALSASSGYGLSDLATGAYKVYSAFSNVGDAMTVETAAAHLARAGNASFADTADALVVAMKAFGSSASDATLDAGMMNQAVIYGKQTMSEFSQSFSEIAATAHKAGMTFAETATAESVLSLQMKNGSMTARDFTNLITHVAYGTAVVGGAAIKAGVAFDSAKFQTLDWAGKLEYLHSFAADTSSFVKMIGGMGNVETAMHNVGMSTKQLATNALQLGINFDTTKYNALGVADKLQYLLDITGGNETRFITLMGGTSNLNTAFQGLKLTTSDVTARAKQLGLTFDDATYKNASFIDKLKILQTLSKGNADTFQTLVGGLTASKAALMLLTDGGKQYNVVAGHMQGAAQSLDQSFGTAMSSVAARGAQLHAVLQNVAYNFLQLIKPALTNFLQGLSVVIGFLASHLQITIPIIVGLAVILGGLVVGALYSVAASFLAVDAAALPFILAIAAVAVVATLVVMHWKQIAPLLAPVVGMFHNVGQTIHQVFQQVVGFLVSTFMPVWQQLQQAFGDIKAAILPIMPQLQRLGMIIGGTIVLAVITLIAILAGLTKMFAGLIIAVTHVVTGIIQVFSGLVQTISGLTQLIVDIMSGKWGNVAKDLNKIMMGILMMFEGGFNILKGLFEAVWATIVGFAQGFASAIVAIFKDLWNVLVGHSIIPDMVNGILQWFGHLFTGALAWVTNLVTNILSWIGDLEIRVILYVTMLVMEFLVKLQSLGTQGISAIQSLATGIINVISQLPGQMMQWGAHMISGFISGIQSMAGNLFGTIGGIASKIAGFLHFTHPDEGPLASAEEWMPHFGDVLAHGMESNTAKLQEASRKMALAAGSGVAVPSTGASNMTGSAGVNPMVGVLSQILTTLQRQGQGSTQNNTSSAFTQQIGSINYHGQGGGTNSYPQFNVLSGLAFEYGQRGATAGLPLS